MQSGTERREQNRREQADNDDAFLESGPLIVDGTPLCLFLFNVKLGVSAGRAAALGALTRMICSKSTSERLPAEQVASYVATVYQSLIEVSRNWPGCEMANCRRTEWFCVLCSTMGIPSSDCPCHHSRPFCLIISTGWILYSLRVPKSGSHILGDSDMRDPSGSILPYPR